MNSAAIDWVIWKALVENKNRKDSDKAREVRRLLDELGLLRQEGRAA